VLLTTKLYPPPARPSPVPRRRPICAWTTDKDGIILDLRAGQITARTGRDPAEHYRTLEEQFGRPLYKRMDAPASPAQKAVLSRLSPELAVATELAGERITATWSTRPATVRQSVG